VNELLARIRAALRRSNDSASAAAPLIEVGPLKIDLVRREVTKGRQPLHLTPIEYRLLTLLAQNAGRVLTQRQILEEVWGRGHAAQNHYVRVYMAQLRRKIEQDPARPRLLVTEPGVGYRLRDHLGPSTAG
jgi:two-component system KDP operon response regulator KdpE